MANQDLDQLKVAVENLSPRERIALHEYLEEFKEFEELDKVVAEFRAKSPTADWEEIMSRVSTAIAEVRDAKANSRIRHQRLRQRSHRKTRPARARA